MKGKRRCLGDWGGAASRHICERQGKTILQYYSAGQERREEILAPGDASRIKRVFCFGLVFFKKQTPQKQPGELERNSGFYDIVKNC
jgi:hypothetical protein